MTHSSRGATYPPDDLLPEAMLPNDSTSPRDSLGPVTPPAKIWRRYDPVACFVLVVLCLVGAALAVVLWAG